jgi:predicted transcriptional regulator
LMHRLLSEYPHSAKALAEQITVRSQALYQALQNLESSVLA